MVGGVQAVTWTDVKQMAVIVGGLLAAVISLIVGLPITSASGRRCTSPAPRGASNTIDFHFDWRQTYTFWSGLLGGLFLMLSYFGCDQSQVQRYLTAKSVQEGRHSLMMSAFVKIPLQALVLLTGVLVFVFYLFNQPPMLFRPVVVEKIQQSARGPRAGGARIRVHAGVRGAPDGVDDSWPKPADGDSAARAAFRTADDRGWPQCGRAPRRSRAAVGEASYKDFTGRHADAGRELRLPDVRHDEAADGPGRV